MSYAARACALRRTNQIEKHVISSATATGTATERVGLEEADEVIENCGNRKAPSPEVSMTGSLFMFTTSQPGALKFRLSKRVR
jgi:hypothetical protein